MVAVRNSTHKPQAPNSHSGSTMLLWYRAGMCWRGMTLHCTLPIYINRQVWVCSAVLLKLEKSLLALTSEYLPSLRALYVPGLENRGTNQIFSHSTCTVTLNHPTDTVYHVITKNKLYCNKTPKCAIFLFDLYRVPAYRTYWNTSRHSEIPWSFHHSRTITKALHAIKS